MKTPSALLLALSLAAAGAAAGAPPDVMDVLKRPNLTLNKSVIDAAKFGLPPGPYEEVDAAMADLKNAADALKAARKAYDEARQSCMAKTYSNQEIQEACAGNDTVDQCSAKLYAHCLSVPLRRVQMAAARLNAAERKLDKAIIAVIEGANKKM